MPSGIRCSVPCMKQELYKKLTSYTYAMVCNLPPAYFSVTLRRCPTSVYCRSYELMELYFCSPTFLHGVDTEHCTWYFVVSLTVSENIFGILLFNSS